MRRALTNPSDNRLSVVDMPMPQVGPGEVLIEIAASYVAPFLNDLTPPDTAFATPARPFAPGLDAIGRIAALGPDTPGLTSGEMVFVDCLIDHGWDGHKGEAAFAGNFAVSTQADTVLEKWQHGTFATHIHMPAANVTLVAAALEHSPAESLCRLGWLGTALGAFRNGRFQAGMKVAVIGASGQVGSSAILIGLALGAGQLTAIGRDPARLAPLEQLAPNIRIETEVPPGCDLVIVASDGDSAPMIEQALATVRRNGAVVLVASPAHPPQVAGVVLREVTIGGSFWFAPEARAEMVEMIASGQLDLSVLTTHTFSLEEVNEALATSRNMPPLHHVALVP